MACHFCATFGVFAIFVIFRGRKKYNFSYFFQKKWQLAHFWHIFGTCSGVLREVFFGHFWPFLGYFEVFFGSKKVQFLHPVPNCHFYLLLRLRKKIIKLNRNLEKSGNKCFRVLREHLFANEHFRDRYNVSYGENRCNAQLLFFFTRTHA